MRVLETQGSGSEFYVFYGFTKPGVTPVRKALAERRE